MLHGKGLWAYTQQQLVQAFEIAPRAGATHILHKVGEGATYYSGMAQVAQAIAAAGLVPFAWGFLRLDDPQGEARVVVRAFQDGFQGFVFDTEADSCKNRFEQARQLGQHLRAAGLAPDKLYNCSFPNISDHRDLPYDQMNEFCKGGLMPMSYGTLSYDPLEPSEQQVRRVMDKWTYGDYEHWCQQWGYRPPLYPVLGPYYDEAGNQRMTPAQFQAWLDRLAAHRPTFFSVFRAGVINDDLLPLIRACPLGEVAGPPPAAVRVVVVSPELGYLNVRPTPSTQQFPIGRVNDGAVLEALEPEEDVRAKVGRDGQWLHVRTPTGLAGYVAAWYLRLYGEVGGLLPYLIVRSAAGLKVRPRPGTDLPQVWHVADKTVLEVREDPQKVAEKVGKDRWIQVRTPSLHEGYVNGLYVGGGLPADTRQPVEDAALPYGECAWIFGIHAAGATTPADFRFLFQGKNKTGWVLFTEAIGANPNHGSGHDYTPWSQPGYGVIVRLNHGYEPAGTLPVRARYADFAAACARYVENSRGCHVWVIGNEQNNVREHPGGAGNPVEHITPEMYAEAFNLARRRIRQVQPEAIVVPGAVDPYNTYPWKLLGGRRNRPLEYFQAMIEAIDDLDGLALHTYTHWLDLSLITQRTVFQDPFLQPNTPQEHYYDFQAYRTFMEAIPEKWRDRPVYITETNHWIALARPPHNPQEEAQKRGWLNENKGWVQAAYEEVHRWNNTPHAQQIHCLLLYRWTGDFWALSNLGKVHEDFKRALDHDCRWRG